MSQRGIIAAIVIIIIVLAGVWYFFSYNSAPGASSSASAANAVATTTSAASGTSGVSATTLRGVVAQGGNYTCSIDTTTGGTKTTGTVYGSAGKTRLDLVISEGGVDTTAHIIRNGSVSYTWVDGQQSGIKSAITPSSPIVQPNGGVISVSDTSTVSSSCHAWIPDATQFTPPAGISFTAQ